MEEDKGAVLDAATETETNTGPAQEPLTVAAEQDAEEYAFSDIPADDVLAQTSGGADPAGEPAGKPAPDAGGAPGVDPKELDEFRAWKAAKEYAGAFALADDEFVVDDLGELKRDSVEAALARRAKVQEAQFQQQLEALRSQIPELLAQHVESRERARIADSTYEELRKSDPILGENAKKPAGMKDADWKEYRGKHEDAVVAIAKRMNRMDIPPDEVVRMAWTEYQTARKNAADIKRSGSRADMIRPGAAPSVSSAPRDSAGRFSDGKTEAAQAARAERLQRW